MSVDVVAGTSHETSNPLLMKNEIGTPLRRGFILPNNNFTYGKSSQGKSAGCAEALANWNTKSSVMPMTGIEVKKHSNANFIKLNKEATKCGLVTAQEQVQYRATHGSAMRDPNEHNSSAGSMSIKRLPPNMVYGVSTKPSTPVFDLLEHKYQDRWLREKRKKELDSYRKDQERGKSAKRDYCETRASRLRRYSPPVDAPPLWQMSKFKKVLPALQTFRTNETRIKAFEHHKSDCTSRTGVFGHGTYAGAKS